MTTAEAPAVAEQSPASDLRLAPEPAIARFLDRLARLGVAPAVVGTAMAGIVLLVGLGLQQRYALEILTLSTVMALSWLGLGPWLIRDAVRLAREFLHSSDLMFGTAQTANRLYGAFVERWRRGWLVFSLLWAGLITVLVVNALYRQAPAAVQTWAAVSFGIVFFMSGVGFWGVIALIRLVDDLAESDLIYRPYHPDRFGGMAKVGSFSVRGALYFSSGALVLPVAFETIGASTTVDGTPALAYVATATFIGFVCAAFLVPIAAIKRCADAGRTRISLEARDRLQSFVHAYRSQPSHDEKLARQAEMYFQMECAELDKLREYPYDLGVLAQFFLAVAAPVAAVLLEALLG